VGATGNGGPYGGFAGATTSISGSPTTYAGGGGGGQYPGSTAGTGGTGGGGNGGSGSGNPISRYLQEQLIQVVEEVVSTGGLVQEWQVLAVQES
jgi:hypothetical protein